MKGYIVGVCLSLFVARGVHSQAATCPAGPPVLVLSGGGAKGMAHIGVIRVLDSLGVRPILVVGTSIGALIGALYASGSSGRQIDSTARTLPLDQLFGVFYGDLPVPISQGPLWAVGVKGQTGFHLLPPAPTVRQFNELVNETLLSGNLKARGNFDSLPIRLRIVATDLTSHDPVVLADGDLAQAARASMAIPYLLPPQVIRGHTLVDGGLSANVPVREARAAGAARVIVSDVTDGLPESVNPESLMWWLMRLWDYANVQKPDSVQWGDVLVQPDVKAFPDLDFSPERQSQLIRLGEEAARSALSRSPCPFAAADDPPGTLPVKMAKGTISGATQADERWLREMFRLDGGDSTSLDVLRLALTHVASTGRYEEVVLNPSGSPDSLVLDIRLRPVPRLLAAIGAAYHGDVGARVWIGALDRRLVSDGVAVSGEVLLGSLRQEVRLGAQLAGRNPGGATPTLSVSLAHERLRIFGPSGEELAGLHTRELAASLGPQFDLGHWVATFGVTGQLWNDPISRTSSTAGIEAQLTRAREAGATSVQADLSWNSAYRRVQLQAEGVLRAGRARLAPMLRFGWGRTLPLQETFVLGGTDGFPGLHIGEGRGDREVSILLGVSHPLAGPLLVHLELGSGEVTTGGPVIPRGRWLVGARVGVGVDAPFGPIMIEYSRAAGRQGTIFGRVGKWF